MTTMGSRLWEWSVMSLLGLMLAGLSAACGRPAASPGDASEFLECPRAGAAPGSAFAFKVNAVGDIGGALLLIGETVDFPAATFSGCSRADVNVVRASAHGGRRGPYAGNAGLSDPFVLPPGKTLRFAGDKGGNAPINVNDLYLVEVLDERGELISAFYLGNAQGSPVTVGGKPIGHLGISSNHLEALTLTEGALPVGKPFRIRATTLIYGGRGQATPLFVVPVDAAGGGEQPNLVLCAPEDHCGGAPSTTAAAAVAVTSIADANGGCLESKTPAPLRGGAVTLPGCTYKIGALLPEGDYELVLGSHLGDSPFSIWLDGTASMELERGADGTPGREKLAMNAVVLRYDGEEVVLLIGPEQLAPAGQQLTLAAGRTMVHTTGRWKIARVGRRLLVWIDDKLIFAQEVPRIGREFGFISGGRASVDGVGVRALAAADVVVFATEADVPAKTALKAAAAQPASPRGKPVRMVGNCNIDSIDWSNREYGASALAKKPFKLDHGNYRLTVKKVKPDPLLTLGSDVQGEQLSLVGVVPVELDGQAPQEVVATITAGDFGIFHGNSIPREPQTMYAFRVTDDCQVQPLGLVDLGADDDTRFENDAIVRIQGRGNAFTVEEWQVQSDKLQRASSRKAGREALDAPLAPCDEAKSRAALPSFAGRPAGEFFDKDPCFVRKLRARLGPNREKFENYASMGLSPLERRGDYLVSSGCMQHYCGYRRAAFSVNVASGVVEALIVDIRENQTIAETKWLTANGAPLAVLMAPIEESIGRATALFGGGGAGAARSGTAAADNPDANLPLPTTKHKNPAQGFNAEETAVRFKRAGWKVSGPRPQTSWQGIYVGEKKTLRISEMYATPPKGGTAATVTVLDYKSAAEAKRAYDEVVKEDRNDGFPYLFGDTLLIVLNRDGHARTAAGIAGGKPLPPKED
jgi:hypothetical protein